MSPNALLTLRDRRNEVIELLCDSYASDLLSEDDFERRLDLVHRADDLVVLNEIVRDIDAPSDVERVGESALATVASHRPKSRNIVAIMGGASCKGTWTVPRKLRVFALMGGAEIDLREVELSTGVTDIRVYTVMGGVDIIVPPRMAIECNGVAIMGAFESLERAPRRRDPSMPLVRISGLALMGAFEVSTRLPGESARDARRRHKRERKARVKASSKLLE